MADKECTCGGKCKDSDCKCKKEQIIIGNNDMGKLDVTIGKDGQPVIKITD